MKAIDLHNGIRRAIQGLQEASTICRRPRRLPIASHHASLPLRIQRSSFSSLTPRRAKAGPPDDKPGLSPSEDAYLPGSGLQLGDELSGELPQDFTAAPAIPELESDAEINEPSSENVIRSDVAISPEVPSPISRRLAPESEQSTKASKRAEASLLKRVRVVPASPSYFTSKPHFTDHYLEMTALFRKFQLLPTSSAGQLTKITWKNLNEYKMYVGQEAVQAGMYRKLLKMCARLHSINPHLMPEEVRAALQRFIKTEQPRVKITKPNVIDSVGRAYGLGRRKAATARAWIVRGEGEVMVNGKSLSQYFSRIHQRESAIYALKVTERVGQYNVFAIAEGGGNTGQAEALTLAVANALIVYEPSLKSRLRTAGCITRDRRRVERKKPGHLKARKKPAWVKR